MSSAPLARPSKQIYIVRHGACALSEALLGQYNALLSEEGLRQAESLAEQLHGKGVERVLSSALRRAVQTAEKIAARLGLEVETDARLNEISYGTWDGLRWGEIERTDPETARRKLQDWWGVTPLGGEPFPTFCRRVRQAWASVLDHRACVTVIVAHRAVNAVLLDLARGAASAPADPLTLNLQQVSTFEQEYGSYELVTVPVGEARQRAN